MRARHRLHEPDMPVDRASDEDVVAVLRGCCSARDRLIVLLMARAGLRRGEVLGLRRSDVHLLADSSALGCGIARAHLHVVRRDDNPNRAVAKSRRQRAVPLDFVTVRAFDGYEFERMTVPAAASGDYVLSGHRDNTYCPEPGVIRTGLAQLLVIAMTMFRSTT